MCSDVRGKQTHSDIYKLSGHNVESSIVLVGFSEALMGI